MFCSDKSHFRFKDRSRDLVVITTVTSWDEPPRIRHQVTKQLSQYYNVLYVQTYPREAKKCKIINRHLIAITVGRSFPGMGRLFILWPTSEVIYKTIISFLIVRIIYKKFDYKKASVINFNYDFPEILKQPLFHNKIYICNDDFVNKQASYTARRIKHNQLRQNEVLRHASSVLAVSVPLVEKLRKYHQRVELFLPGVDFMEIANSITSPIMKNNEDSIKVAFMGYINEKLNVDWLKAVLRDKRLALFMIGPVECNSIMNVCSSYKNFFYLSPIYGKPLVEKLAEMDVLIIPYSLDNDLSTTVKAISAPNKLFVYLNTGRPVVISDMPSFIDIKEPLIYRANNVKEFLEKIHLAVFEDAKCLRRDRVKLAENNSWEKRIEILLRYLDNNMVFKEHALCNSNNTI